MRICYDLTLDDVVALNRYHIAHSPAVQRALAIWRAMPLAIGLFAIAALTLLTGEPLFAVSGGVSVIVFGGLWFVIAPAVYRWRVTRAIRAAMSEGKDGGMIGPHELGLAGDDLNHSTPVAESRMKCSALDRVVSDGGYTFIYQSALQAHIIRHTAVTEGDPEAFAAALRQKLTDNPSAVR